MYSVVPAAGQAWQRLFEGVGADARVPLTYLEHRAPKPISELWSRQDVGAVFMCGLPFARSIPPPRLVAAPVPSPPDFREQPQYWSDLVVRADSDFEALEDTFGHRIALTTMKSQSGCLALLYHLMPFGGTRALYQTLIEPRLTPMGAMTAVVEGLADVAPVDSFAFSLARQYVPELTSQLRTIERTVPTPIPPIVASGPVPASLESAFLEAHKSPSMQPLLADLQLARFLRPDPETYDVLKRRFDAAIPYWRQHPFACSAPAAFAELATGKR
jgi:hypothetical protein